MICPNCKFNVESNKFCNECGTPLDTPFVNSNKNKGSWVIAPGEIARHISENDFANIAHLSGIIIQPGVSALIYSDGREIAQIGSGHYDFITDREIDSVANERCDSWNSVRGAGLNIWKALKRLMLGRKVGETVQEFNQTQHTREEIIRHLNSRSNFSLYLKVDKPFPALFGFDQFKTGKDSFVPMKIRTKLFDIDVCVSLMLQISDFRECIRYYMTGKKSLTTADIQAAVSPYITRILQDALRNEEVGELGLTEEIKSRIGAKLIDAENYLHGIKITGIPEITSSNGDLERFRTLARELYCSEKELDYLRRTNEFHNRLSAAEIEQKVGKARSELDLTIALDEVNKDRLLHEEEVEQLKQTLRLRKEDRDLEMAEAMSNSAITKMEIAASVQKRELVIEAEMEQFKSDIEFEKYKHNAGHESEKIDIEEVLYGKRFAAKKRALIDKFDLEDEERHQKYKVRMEDADINGALIKKTLDHKRMNDEYEREKREYDYAHSKRVMDDNFDFKRRQRDDELDYITRQSQISLSAIERMNQMSESNLDNQYRRESIVRQEEQRHEQYLAELERQKELDRLQAENQRTGIFSGMSAEQIAATALASGINAGDISDNAVGSITDMLNSQQEAAAAKAILRAREEDFIRSSLEKDRMIQTQREDMKEMMGMAMNFSRDAMMAASSERERREREKDKHMEHLAHMQDQRYEDAVQLKEEYRSQMMHEQERIDKTQDKALDYTTKVTTSDNKVSSKNSDSKETSTGNFRLSESAINDILSQLEDSK